jgi:hypothetical protein
MEVEQISGVIGDPSTWKARTVEEGELVTVKNPSGVGWIRMAKGEAVRLGLWKDEERGEKGEERKAQQPKTNKQRRSGANKRTADLERNG